MRYSTLVLCALVIGSAGWNVGCLPDQPVSAIKPVSLTQNKVDLSVVRSRDNLSFIPINQRGRPSLITEDILDLVQKFGEAHPDWEILDVNIEAWPLNPQPEDKGNIESNIFTYGLWVLHKPKVK